jgi:hypothetical protein
MLGILALGVLVSVGTVMLGRSGSGQIDVAAAVREAGAQMDAEGNQLAPVNVPSSEFRNMPNGGLVPAGDQAAPPPQEPSPVGTTTDALATTTEETSEGTDVADTDTIEESGT